MNKIGGSTKVIGIIGNPIGHTLSPAMHNAGLKATGINAVYVPFFVHADGLSEAVRGMGALNFLGFNVTVPYKEKVIEYLNEIDPLAEKIGAVNTVVSHYGKLKGYNTDATGFIKSLGGKFNVKGKKILILGAGGAGKAISFALIGKGAAKVFVYDVDKEKARNFTEHVIEVYELKETIKDVEMLVNATPVGMKESAPAINPEFLRKDLFVYDIVYNRQTELLKEARKRKIKCVSGIEMLLYQGVESFELWTGKKAPVEVMRNALLRELRKKGGD
ncbi:MAG: shikimate dehydrogenase [Elusimicrobiota bacterium]